MDTEERLRLLEARLAEYDRLIAKLRAYASVHPTGRVLLKFLGIS